jgi:hypothetical protein
MFVDIRKNPQVAKANDRFVHRVDYAKAQLGEKYLDKLSRAADWFEVQQLLASWQCERSRLEPATPVGRFTRWLARVWPA